MHDRAHIPHQAIWLAHFSSLDGLVHDYEDVVNSIVQILRAKMPTEKEANAFFKVAIQLR